ncbi:RWD domain-containing protein 1 isoform X2 [Hippoglossus hippoglossus]|uniref:RWD domain-containing protein 1 isoform X2 n=1 Tax=Hippoglossus hippoglossus TaxID=8267 RepID=UPI00148BBCEB|nr:RWD domain-containing protein 1 isoform X2 [Hippoglossus hippoglossus]
MTDYAEEQRNELEAIESIYEDSFTVLTDEPTSFTITVASDAGEQGEIAEATLKFTYVEKYPDEPPLWEIYSQDNLEDGDALNILTLLQQQAEENLGMVMIFTLVTAVQEKLNEIVDLMKNRQEEEKQRKEREAEEAEKITFQGTVVNIENFLLWKTTFELEVAELRHKKQQKEEEQALKTKLTGNADVLTFTLFPQGSQLEDLITQTDLTMYGLVITSCFPH